MLYANYGRLQAGKDADFLLISLIVVIIGGMGSRSAAPRSARLLFGLVDTFSDIYLPQRVHELRRAADLRAARRGARGAAARALRTAGMTLDTHQDLEIPSARRASPSTGSWAPS